MKKTIIAIDNSYCLYGINKDIAEQLDSAIFDVASSIKEGINKNIKSAKKSMRNTIAMSFIKQTNQARKQIDFRMMNASSLQISIAAKISANRFSILIEKYTNLDSVELFKLFYSEHNSENIPLIQLPKSIPDDFNEKLCSVKYLTRKINIATRQSRELLAIKLGLVGKYGKFCISDEAVNELKQAKIKTENFLSNKVLANKKTGQYFSISNLPDQHKQKHAEILCFANGLNDYAIRNNFSTAFITITAPASLRFDKRESSLLTPKEIQSHLAKKWAIYKKRIDQWTTPCFILRVVEPHKDGTPHWHILLFFPAHMKARHKEALLKAFGLKSLKSKRICWLEPPLTGNYGLHYVIKKMNCDFGSANNINQSLKNVRRSAFLKAWQISGHEFLGLPRFTRSLWNELKFSKYPYCLPTPLKQMSVMSEKNCFAEFLELLLKHQKNIEMISAPTESGKTTKVIGIRWEDQEFFSKDTDYAIMPQDFANQLLIEKTRGIVLNKPSNTNGSKNKIIDRTKNLKSMHLYSIIKTIAKRLWGLLNNLI